MKLANKDFRTKIINMLKILKVILKSFLWRTIKNNKIKVLEIKYVKSEINSMNLTAY